MKTLLATLFLVLTLTSNAGPWTGCCVTQSGYPGVSGTINSIQGSFIVPSIPAVETTDVSFWVGIGGYGSKDVQQIGIDVYFVDGSYQANIWWEMYPKKMQWETFFDISAGDRVTFSVRYLGSDKFELKWRNDTTGNTFSTVQFKKRATRNSAEFICEQASGWALPRSFAVAWTDLAVNGLPVSTWNWRMVNQLGITVTPLVDNSFSVMKP